MSTAVNVHHRYSDPLAIAAAVVVLVGSATVLGVAMVSEESAAPTAPTAPERIQVDKPPSARIGGDLRQDRTVQPPSRIGMGDFTQP